MNERMYKINNLIEYILDNDLYKKHSINGIDCDVYQKLDDLYKDFKITNINDRIAVAQKGYNYDLAVYLFTNLSLSDSEEKLLKIVKADDENYYETLNPEILSDRYSFIHEYLSIIYSDIDFQIELISLNDEELELLKKIYKKLNEEVTYPINYLARILRCITINPFACLQSYSTYDGNFVSKKNKLFSDIAKRVGRKEKVSDSDLDLLLYFLINLDGFFVNKYEEMVKYPECLKKRNDEVVNSLRDKDRLEDSELKKLKNSVLMGSFGISYGFANYILSKYRLDGIVSDSYSSNYISTYYAIKDIVRLGDEKKLFDIYDSVCINSDIKLDYISMVLFEQGLRKVFSREINKKLFRTDEIVPDVIDGVEVYNYDMDSCLLLTSVGAYKNDFVVDDYKEYWSSRKVRSHSNRCNLINSNNLAMPDIMNVALGFTNFNNNMLLKSNVRRFNSNLSNRTLNSIDDGSQVFMLPDSLVLSTRSTCNELVYERRDLDNEKIRYKKLPTYVVYFEELEENTKITSLELKEYLIDYKKVYENSLKAAKDFGVPLVIVNRESCAKKGNLLVQKLVDEYLETKNCNLIFDIFKMYESNRNGLGKHHSLLRDKYFSEEWMSEIVDSILKCIKTIHINDRELHLKCLEYAILGEEKRLNDVLRDSEIKPSYNKTTIMSRIKTLREDMKEA